MQEPTRILIADDHSIVSRGLYYLLTLHFSNLVINDVSSINALKKSLSATFYSHLILDINLDAESSIEELPSITTEYPDLKILVYSMASEDIYTKRVMQFDGVCGFLSKKADEQEMLVALRIFLNGGIYVNRKQKNNASASENVFLELSDTELIVLRKILSGIRSKEIAYSLNVTQQTIATYKTRIYKKLGTDNLFEIQKMAELFKLTSS